MTNVTFNSYDLQTAAIITTNSTHYNAPSKSATMYPIAHANKSTIPFINYPNRRIVLTGHLVAGTVSALDTLCDTFKQEVDDKDGNLDFDYAGSTRRFVGTVVSTSIERPQGLSYALFTLEFDCIEPFGKDTSNTTAWSNTNQTGSIYTTAHSFEGTAPEQLPVITVTIDSVTDGSNSITVKNNDTGKGITVSGQTFVATDVLEIDCVNRTVKVNSTEVDFTGEFPVFPPGTGNIRYQDNFTTRQFDINVVYKALYL